MIVHLVVVTSLKRRLRSLFVYRWDMVLLKSGTSMAYVVLYFDSKVFLAPGSFVADLVMLGVLIVVRSLYAAARTRNRLTVLIEMMMVLLEYYPILWVQDIAFALFSRTY